MPAALRPADPELRCNLLGMTETGSVSLYGDGDTDLPERKRGCFGRPVPGIEARVVDPDTGADAPEGDKIELWGRRIGRSLSLLGVVVLAWWLGHQLKIW